MNDLELWATLEAAATEPAPSVAQLEQLTELPVGERFVFFAHLARILQHDDAGLRRAALQALRGAEGWCSRSLVVDACADDDISTRDTAI